MSGHKLCCEGNRAVRESDTTEWRAGTLTQFEDKANRYRECENDSFRLKILSLTDELFFIEKHEPSYGALLSAFPFLIGDSLVWWHDWRHRLYHRFKRSPYSITQLYMRRKVEWPQKQNKFIKHSQVLPIRLPSSAELVFSYCGYRRPILSYFRVVCYGRSTQGLKWTCTSTIICLKNCFSLETEQLE